MTPPLVLVAALGKNRVIGRDNSMPWRLPTDLARYRAITWGKPMLMGRKTFLSIGRALPGRESIVLTRDPDFVAAGAQVVHSLDEALALAKARAAAMGAGEVIVAGGADLYAQTIALADRLRLTLIEASPQGDALFPPVDPGRFGEVFREAHPASRPDDHAFAFVDYERREAG